MSLEHNHFKSLAIIGLTATELFLGGCRPVQYEYCVLPDTAGVVDKVIGDQDVKPAVLFPGDINKIKEMDLRASDITWKFQDGNERATPPVTERLQVLLIPVGYNDKKMLIQRMEYIANGLSKVYGSLPIDFHYVNISVPVGIQHVERFATATDSAEIKAVVEQVRRFADINEAVVLFNSDQYMGSGGDYAVSSGNNPKSLFTAAHEFGHVLRLDDGAPRYYDTSTSGGYVSDIGGTELFTSTRSLAPKVATVYDPSMPIRQVAGVCKNEQLYRFYDSAGNIMDKSWQDEQLLSYIAAENKIFNPLQIGVMNNYICERVKGNRPGYGNTYSKK